MATVIVKILKKKKRVKNLDLKQCQSFNSPLYCYFECMRASTLLVLIIVLDFPCFYGLNLFCSH